MKKVALLTILLVVAASAAITIEFPGDPPSKVGDSVRVTITASVVVDLAVDSNGTKKPWVSPQTLSPGTNYVQITHPGSGLMLYASKLGDEDYSDPFDVVIGDAERWQIIGPGQTSDPGNAGNPSGKTPNTATVTAGDVETYPVNLCDKWYNVVDPSPTGYTITTNDPFGRVNGDQVELRTAPGSSWDVTVSGASYTSDVSNVKVNPDDATQLLILCEGETYVPGDTLSSAQKGGKTETPGRAIVGLGYPVKVYAVDNAWNVNPSATGSVYVHGGISGGVNSDTVALSNGTAPDTVFFQIAAEDGKDIYAATTDGALKTEYPTKVFVSEGVLFIEASLDPSIVPIDVHSELRVTVYADSATTIFNYPVYISVVEEDLKQYVSCSDPDWVVYTDPNQNDVAKADIWASAETTYTIRVTAGEQTKDLPLTIKELTELLVAPNPFKYGSPGHDEIKFMYKVAQAGAAEVLLLIADPYGNIVYKATYTSGEVVSPGQQEISWDGKNSKGNMIASGMYQAVVKVTLTNLSTEVLKKNFMVIW